MKILVTGGAGFIGSHIVDKLIQERHKVVVMDSLEKQVHPKFPRYLNPKANYYFGRIEDNHKIGKILKNTQIIFHCASRVGVSQSQYEIYDFIKANVGATAFILNNCIKSNVKKIIFSGSMAPYGEGPYICEKHGIVYPKNRTYSNMIKNDFESKCPFCKKSIENIAIKEDQKFNPLSYYAISKQTQESMIHLFGRVYNIQTISLRYFSVYGSRQTLGNPYAGPIPIFIENLFKKERPIVFEGGKQTRDFVHVSDIVNANILAMNSHVSQKCYNIGSGKKTSILELANEICDLMNTNIKPLITNKFRIGDIRNSLANISKAKKDLKYRTSVSLKEGLQEVLEWTKQESENKC